MLVSWELLIDLRVRKNGGIHNINTTLTKNLWWILAEGGKAGGVEMGVVCHSVVSDAGISGSLVEV